MSAHGNRWTVNADGTYLGYSSDLSAQYHIEFKHGFWRLSHVTSDGSLSFLTTYKTLTSAKSAIARAGVNYRNLL